MTTFHLFVSALVSGLLIGAFYAALASGLALVFGVLEIPNLAHPAAVVAAAMLVHTLNRVLVQRSEGEHISRPRNSW